MFNLIHGTGPFTISPPLRSRGDGSDPTPDPAAEQDENQTDEAERRGVKYV